MQRREFLKDTGLITAGCVFGAGAVYSVKDKQDEVRKDKKDDWLPHIEISLCYHCNLNCAYCMHCCAIAPVYYMPLNIFEKDIARMSKITNGKIRNIMLLGGEPLLNKNIKEYMKITRQYFCNSEIIIFTNGLILNSMPDSFWKTCKKYNIEIWHTNYPLCKKNPNLEKAYQKSLKYKIKVSSYIRYTFGLMGLSKKNNNDKCKTYEKCSFKTKSTIVDNGILYPCPVIFSVKLFLNNKFKDFALPVDKNDLLDIYKLNSIADLNNFLKTPKEFCKYCNYGSKQAIWRPSERKISEWFDV